MFLHAKNLNIKLEPLSDKLCNHVFAYLISNKEITITQNRRKKIKQVCNCFIYNASQIVPLGIESMIVTLHKEDYSRPAIINGAKVKSQPVSYQYMRILFDVVCQKFGCHIDKGGYSHTDENGKHCFDGSLFTFSESLFSEFYDAMVSAGECPTRESVLEIRDEKKKPKTFQQNEKTRQIIEELNMYNKVALEHTVTDAEGNPLRVQAYRVFNTSLECGGRIYTERGAVQNLPSEQRSKILIDGQKVTEVDFCHLHPSILAIHNHYKFEDDFDPYGIACRGYEPKLLRKLAKLCLLIRINCTDDRQFFNAFSSAVPIQFNVDELYQNKLIPDPLIDPRRILNCVVDHNQYLIDSLNKCSGVRLQAKDSEIAMKILNYFQQRDIMCIGIHDSFIVPVQEQQRLIDVMRWAYEVQMGTTDNLRVDVKY